MDIDGNMLLSFKGMVADDVPLQQFALKNIGSQNAIVSVVNENTSAYLVRLLIIFKAFTGKRDYKVIGMTSVKRKQGEFCFAGLFPHGNIYLLPISIRASDNITSNNHESSIKLVKEINGHFVFTAPAKEAAEVLFNALDSNMDFHLSRNEMQVIKINLTGFKGPIEDDEWSAIVMGGNVGEFDEEKGISFEIFLSFLLRLADESVIFIEQCDPLKEEQTRQHSRPSRSCREVEANLKDIFKRFGFDDEMQPTYLSSYRINISYRRGLSSAILAISIFNPASSLATFTRTFGNTSCVLWSYLQLSIFKADDFTSISVRNTSNREVMIAADMSESKNVVPVVEGIDGYVWKNTLLPRIDQFIGCFGQNYSKADMKVTVRIVFINDNGDLLVQQY